MNGFNVQVSDPVARFSVSFLQEIKVRDACST